MPKLSVIIPVYNVKDYLSECLDALLTQLPKDVEVIAVNDGSTDESPQILSTYQDKYPDLLVYHKENGGLSDARNFGLDRASGEYVAFVDSDDVVTEDFFSSLLPALGKCDLLYFDYETFTDSGKTLFVKNTPREGKSLQKSLLIAPPMAWMRVYRRSLLGKDPFVKGIYYEDLEMTPRMALKADSIEYLPKMLYRYRQREGSIMSAPKPEHKDDIFKVCLSLLCHFEKEGKREEYESELEYLFIEHLLRTSAFRFAPLKGERERFCRLGKTVKEHFPRWKNNPYLATKSRAFRLAVTLSSLGMKRTLAFLAKLKG